jgi:hypothetical protein
MLVRFGNGRPSDSQVLRPISTQWPVVVALKYFRSTGKCHGMAPFCPMALSAFMATMADNSMGSNLFFYKKLIFIFL